MDSSIAERQSVLQLCEVLTNKVVFIRELFPCLADLWLNRPVIKFVLVFDYCPWSISTKSYFRSQHIP